MQQYHVQAQPQGHSQAQYSPRQLLESARRAEADGNVDLAAHVSRYVVEHFAGTPESVEAYNSLMRLGQPPLEHGPVPAQAPVIPQSKQIMPSAYANPAPQSNGMSTRFNGTPSTGPSAPTWAPAPQPAPAFAHGQPGYAPPPPARGPAPMPQAASAGAYGAQMQTPVQTIAANFAPAAPYRGAENTQSTPPAMIHHAPEVTPQYRGGRIVARLAFATGGLMIASGVVSPILAFTGMIGAAPSLLGVGLVACALIATGLLALLGGQTALAVFDQADNMRELVELERTRWGA